MAKAVEVNRSFKKWGYGESCQVEFVKMTSEAWQDGNRYAVIFEGEQVGIIYGDTRTWSRKSAGSRISTTSGTTSSWYIECHGGIGYGHDTRNEAAFALVRNANPGRY
jgi:hypothetical protein